MKCCLLILRTNFFYYWNEKQCSDFRVPCFLENCGLLNGRVFHRVPFLSSFRLSIFAQNPNCAPGGNSHQSVRTFPRYELETRFAIHSDFWCFIGYDSLTSELVVFVLVVFFSALVFVPVKIPHHQFYVCRILFPSLRWLLVSKRHSVSPEFNFFLALRLLFCFRGCPYVWQFNSNIFQACHALFFLSSQTAEPRLSFPLMLHPGFPTFVRLLFRFFAFVVNLHISYSWRLCLFNSLIFWIRLEKVEQVREDLRRPQLGRDDAFVLRQRPRVANWRWCRLANDARHGPARIPVATPEVRSPQKTHLLTETIHIIDFLNTIIHC